MICARCAKYCRNSDFFSLPGVPAIVLQDCEGVLQWFCFAALRGGLAMPWLGGFDCEGVLQWFDFTVLREGVAMTHVYKHYEMFGSLG